MVTQILFYALIVLVVVVAMALVILTTSHQRLLAKNLELESAKKELEEKLTQKNEIFEAGRKKIKSEIEDMVGKESAEYQKILEGVKGKAKGVLDEISQVTKEASLKEVKALSGLISQRVDEEYIRVRSELETYKKERLAEIENKMGEIIKQVTREVIGESLNEASHQELVVKALERAKKENVF